MQKQCKNCKYYSPLKNEEEIGFGSCECPKCGAKIIEVVELEEE